MAVLVQQLDNDLLAPIVFGKNLELHPLVVLGAIVAGSTLFGAFGAVLAVPVTAVIINVMAEIRADGQRRGRGRRRARSKPGARTRVSLPGQAGGAGGADRVPGTTRGASMEQTVIEIAESVRRGERRAVEVLDDALAAVAAGNERLGAFVHLDEGLARAAAEAVDAAVAAGHDPGPFAGVPIGVKDLEDCAGHADLPRARWRSPAGARWRTTRSTWPGCGPPARCRSARRPPPSSARSTSPGPRCSAWPATRGTPSARPAGRAGAAPPRWPPGWCPAATASDGGRLDPHPGRRSAASSGSSPATAASPTPGPPGSETAVYGLLTTTVADSARHLDVAAGPDDRDRFSLPAATVRYE